MRVRWAGVVSGVLLAAVLLLSGCGVIGTGSDDEPSASSGSSSSGSSASESGTVSGTGGSGASGTAVEGLGDPIATSTVPGPDGLEISLLDATVVGDLLRVRLAFTPTTVPDGDYSVYDMNHQSRADPYLLDATNLLRYEVVLSEGVELADDVVLTTAVNGAPLVTTQYYAAPEDPTAPLQLAWGSAPWPTFEFTPRT